MGTPSPLAKGRGTTKPGLTEAGAKFQVLDEFELIQKTADSLAEGKAIGWFQGRMEYGPRALGNRSILGDPRSAEMQKSLNLKVKYRESFRPFAPAVRIEDVGEWFDLNQPSPYMLFVDQVAKQHCRTLSKEDESLEGLDRLRVPRSDIPAVTHVDFSARIQTVHRETNEKFYDLLTTFKDQTGCPILVNTRVRTHYSHQMTAAARAIAAMKFLMLRSKRVAIRRQSLRRQNMRSMMLRCL